MMKPTPTGPMFKSREEILAECASVGVTPATRWCCTASGARASNTLVALKEAGIENVTLYFGSERVVARPALPIETGLPFKTTTAAASRLDLGHPIAGATSCCWHPQSPCSKDCQHGPV